MIADTWNELAPRVTEWARESLKAIIPAGIVGILLYAWVNGSGGNGGGKDN